MSADNTIKTFTAADIEKYHKGLLSAKEMHDIEKAALDDPFLADAMEGYAVEGVNVNDDIAELKKRLASRTDDKKVVAIPARFNWLKIAAIFVLIAGGGYFMYQFGFSNKQENITQSPVTNKAKETPPANNETATVKESPAINSTTPEKPKTATNDKPAAIELEKQTVTREEDVAKENIPQSDTIVVIGYGTQKKKDIAGAVSNIPVGNEIAKNEDDKKEKDSDADGVKDNFDKSVAAKSKRQDNAQGFSFQAETKQPLRNIFRGRITDSSNNPLPFANITNIEDNVGTYADAKGNFVLTSPDSILNVQVRSIGFANNNVRLKNYVVSNKVVMSEDYSGLTEIVVSNKRNVNSARSRSNTMVLEEPEPEDGWENYDTYLANNLNEPETFRSKQPEGGEVEVSFEVNENGEPINIKVEKSLCASCDKEAIRLVKEGPKFKRKAKKGKRTTVAIPF